MTETAELHDHDGGHAAHAHFSADRFDRAVGIGVVLNSAFVVVEAAAGFAADSLSLLADAGHNAGDVVGLLTAWGAAWLARRPATLRYTWGFRRSTIFAAVANASLLLAACGAISWEACRRFFVPEASAGGTMIVVALIGAAINTATALLLHRGSSCDLNVRGAFLHMAADAAVSVGVAIAGTVVLLTGWEWIDPVTGLLITAVIAFGAWHLLGESVALALDAAPRRIDPEKVSGSLEGIEGVESVHDLHVWSPGTSDVSATVHLVVPDVGRHEQVLAAATDVLTRRFGIGHSTVQIERTATCRKDGDGL